MSKTTVNSRNPSETRRRLVDATLGLMLRQGFAGTTVDQICAEAKVTKGGFFHYFASKEAMGRAALDRFAEIGTEIYSAAWKNADADPLERIHQFFEIMIGLARTEREALTCMVGMLSQEMAQSNAQMREACAAHLGVWTENLRLSLAEAKKKYPPKIDFDPESVSWFLNSVWQGSMLIGKTRRNPEMVVSNLRHGRAYVDGLFEGLPRTVKSVSKTRKTSSSSKSKIKNVKQNRKTQ